MGFSLKVFFLLRPITFAPTSEKSNVTFETFETFETKGAK